MRIYDNPLGMSVEVAKAFLGDVLGEKAELSVNTEPGVIAFTRETHPVERDLKAALFTATGELFASLHYREPLEDDRHYNPRFWVTSLNLSHEYNTLIPGLTHKTIFPRLNVQQPKDKQEIRFLQYVNIDGQTAIGSDELVDAKKLNEEMGIVGDALRQALTSIVRTAIDAGLLPEGKTVGDYITSQTPPEV